MPSRPRPSRLHAARRPSRPQPSRVHAARRPSHFRHAAARTLPSVAIVAVLTMTLLGIGLSAGTLWAFSPADDQRATVDVPAGGRSTRSPVSRARVPPTRGPALVPSTRARPPVAAGPAASGPALSTDSLDFGADTTRRSVDLVNPSGVATGWAAEASTSAVIAVPSSGALPAGGRATLTVLIDRSGLAEGRLVAEIDITSAGAPLVLSVLGLVERAPVIDALQVSGGRAWLDPRCGDTTPALSVAVDDESRVASVDIVWLGPGGYGRIRARRGQYGRWSADLPPQRAEGQVIWQVEAADGRGNLGRSSKRSLPIAACSR